MRGALSGIICTVALLLGAAAHAQEPEFPDSLLPEHLVLSTDRFASTHNASLSLDYPLQDAYLGGHLRAWLTSSTTLHESPITRDQVDLLAHFEYDLPSPVDPFFVLEGTLTNDIGALVNPVFAGLNNTAATFLGVGGRASDDAGNFAALAFGGAYNRQLNTEDAGGAFYGEFGGLTELGGYQLRADGRARWQNTSPRQNSTLRLLGQVDRDFGDGILVSFTGELEQYRSDLYIKRPEEDLELYGGVPFEGIQQRTERHLRIGSFFLYPVNENLSFDFDLGVTGEDIVREESDRGLPPLPRDLDPFQYAQNDIAVAARIGSQYHMGPVLVFGRMQYRASEERNGVEAIGEVSDAELRRKRLTGARNDFVSEFLQFAGGVSLFPSLRDTVTLNSSIGIYRYDTPDTANNFDKDEQSMQFEARYQSRLSRYLALEVVGQAFLTHLVYLQGENSNDNNWNRVFRIAPAVEWTVSGLLSNRLTAQVLANYTEYDFEGRSQNIRGRSYRELGIRDSISLRLPEDLLLTVDGEMRIAERGSFSWEQFAESLLESVRSEGLAVEIGTGNSETFFCGVGGKLSRVRTLRADPLGTLFPSSDRTSVGPTARCRAAVTSTTYLEASGWWEHRFEESVLIDRTPWLELAMHLRL